jgi:hypothetical protein
MNKYIALVALTVTLISCESEDQKGERLAKQYCGSCHVFPDPNLLPKEIWSKNVLPNMAFRMGLTDLMDAKKFVPIEDLLTVVSKLPDQPMVTSEEWQSIVNYFNRNSPAELSSISQIKPEKITLLEPVKVKDINGQLPLVTLIKVDTLHNKIFIGSRNGTLDVFNNQFEFESSKELSSPVSHVAFTKNNDLIMSLMGIMDPNDRPKGQLVLANPNGEVKKILVDSIKRPVSFEQADLNSDGLDDFVICAFGNFTGELFISENKGDSLYVRHTISNLPGARNVILTDFNKDGKLDIIALLTQGDEQITYFKNLGDFKFEQKVLLRFPPVYGSSYFEIADFNGDGRVDILYTNGDNSDLSMIYKPYHGVRIFMQHENGEFKESWFYKMDGASKAMAYDFDMDGDLDIAAISFFSDFENKPDCSFIYFENSDLKFTPTKLAEAASGRWVVMEIEDIDHDGDKDILLGALDFKSKVPAELFNQWSKEQTAVLLLRNLTK